MFADAQAQRQAKRLTRYASEMAKLHFYYSAMNAGKSTILLQANHNYLERGLRTQVYTPALDNRYERGFVTSRIGLRAPAVCFDVDDDLEALTRSSIEAQGRLACVLVDEAQFLTRAQVWQLTELVDQLDLPVLAYGLRTDFMGELFEGSQYLLAWADELVEVKTICHSGRKATMVVRVDDQGHAVTHGAQIEIGGNERYVSVSRREYKAITRGEGRLELKQAQLPLPEPDDTGRT